MLFLVTADLGGDRQSVRTAAWARSLRGSAPRTRWGRRGQWSRRSYLRPSALPH